MRGAEDGVAPREYGDERLPLVRMSALIRPRGPLPRRVYWFRRALVLLVAVGLVLLVVRLVGDEDAGAGKATGVAARVAAGDPASSPKAGPGAASESPTKAPASTAQPSAEKKSKNPKPSPTKRPLPKPDGPCEPADVLATPVATGSRSDGSVDVTLGFSTVDSAACTFEVSAQSVFLTISSGERTVWASQHCGSTMPTEKVVPRRTKPAELVVRWDGRESAAGCPETEWVEPGEYTVAALARGSVNVRKTTFTLKGSG